VRRIFFNIIITVEFPFLFSFQLKLHKIDRKVLIDHLLRAAIINYSAVFNI
jgi:hypothetical protein